MLRRLVGRDAIERHQRGRSARRADDLRPPPVDAYRRHFNEVRAAVDGFFEMEDVHEEVSL